MAAWEGHDYFEEVDIFKDESSHSIPSTSIGTLEVDSKHIVDAFSQKVKSNLINGIEENDMSPDVTDVDVDVVGFNKVITTYEAYTVYTIVTKSNRAEFKKDSYTVQHRYNSFVWLRNRLDDQNPMLIVPVLPGKHSIKEIDRFSGSFLEQRRAALDRFMKRVVAHPILSCSEDIVAFLTGSKEEFASYMSSHPTSGNFLTRLASGIQLSGSSSSGLAENGAGDCLMDEFGHVYREADRFCALNTRMEHVASRLASKRTEWSRGLGDMSRAMLAWSSGECGGSAEALVSVAGAWDRMGVAVELAGEMEGNQLAPGWREHARCAAVVQKVLHRRRTLEAKLESLRSELDQVQEALSNPESAPTNHTSSPSLSGLLRIKESPTQRMDRLNKKLEQLSHKVNEFQDRCACADAQFRSEYERWESNRRRETTTMLRELADTQVQLFAEAVSGWSESLRSLGSILGETPLPTEAAGSEQDSGRI